MGLLHEELSNTVLTTAFRIHRELGPGLLESVYEEAFCVELKLSRHSLRAPEAVSGRNGIAAHRVYAFTMKSTMLRAY